MALTRSSATLPAATIRLMVLVHSPTTLPAMTTRPSVFMHYLARRPVTIILLWAVKRAAISSQAITTSLSAMLVFAAESNTIRIGRQGTQTATYVSGIFGATITDGAPVLVDTNGH